MKKEDFLEILKDYLKNSFSQEEIMDIIRDYEEYFIDGTIEGKTEMEIISGLGSPKEIAKALISENNAKSENKFKAKGKSFLIDVKSKFKVAFSKFKINLNDKGHVKSRKKVKLLQVLVTLILIPFVIGIATATIGLGIGLVGSIMAAIVGTPFAISLASIMPEVKMVIIFGVIAYIGLEILVWQLLFAILKLEKRAINIYTRWMKTNQLYINGSIKKEEIDQNGGMLDE